MEALAKELCCNCGSYVDELNQVSGWCYVCSPPTCLVCNEQFDNYGQSRECCPKCRRELWDIENADAIELYMAYGLTLTKAREAVKKDARPSCLCCGESILYGNPKKDRFCNKPDCRTAARRYKYYTRDKRMLPSEALVEVAKTLTREIQA
jgi:hypothetical protein